MKKGFYFALWGYEFFVETEQKNKTNKLVEKIINAINQNTKIPKVIEITEGNISYILYLLTRANLEVKHCSRCSYYNIFGNNFSGYGSNVEDGKTIIIKL